MKKPFVQNLFPPNIGYRNFIFIPLFFAFYIVLKVFGPMSITLEQFSGRSISVATSEAIDIGKRVALFYKAIGFATVLIFLFTRLMIKMKTFFIEEEVLLANGISLAGFCLLFFQLVGADMLASIHFIFALELICLSGFVFHQVKKRFDKEFKTVFVWAVLISISLFFLQWQVLNFFNIKKFLSLPAVIVITGIPLYLFFTNEIDLNYRILRSSRPLIFLPLLSFLCVELFLIFNQHGISLVPGLLYSIGLVIIILRVFSKFRNHNETHPPGPLLSILFRRWMPWVLAGITCITFYQPIVKPAVDMFEDANRVLPLQQWYSFGKLPFLDSLSGHDLNDFGFGMLYSLLNGPDPMGVFVYQFLMGVTVILLIYFLMYKITGDGFLATWIAIAYPYADFLLPSYFNLVPLTALSFILLYEKQTVSRYVYFFCSLLFMIIWRVDIGVSTLVAGIIGFAFLVFFVPTFKTERTNLLKGLGITLSILLVFFIAAFIHSGMQLFTTIKDALVYMSSFQSYGIRDLSSLHDMKYFSLYFIFPAVVLLILIHCMYQLVHEESRNNVKTFYRLALIFLGIFYLGNIQRGLVRHTLAEQWDTALTSFGFFIVSSVFLIRYLNKNPFIRFFVFFIAGTLIVSNYVFTTPDLWTNNYYNDFTTKLNGGLYIPATKEKVKRVVKDPEDYFRYNDLSRWMSDNFTGKATFLDFSNTPMLYYYLNRVVPNYFVQIPHTAHNEFLQRRFVEGLKEYDIPAVIFSNVPQSFWDNMDGIPNTLRHYLVAEYIHRNYKPGLILNGHCIWVKKDKKLSELNELLSIPVNKMIRERVVFSEDSILRADGEHGFISYKFDSPIALNGKKFFAIINSTSYKNDEIIFRYVSSAGKYDDKQKSVLKISDGQNNLFVMMVPSSKDKDFGEIRIELSSESRMKIYGIKIFSSNIYPDMLSGQPSDYSLKWIPYIWGSYDRNFKAEKIEVAEDLLSETKVLDADKETKFYFQPVNEKEFGNYIKFTAKVSSGKQTNVFFSYGEGETKRGSFNFLLKDDTLFHDYLVRVSSQYNWYSRNNSWLRLNPQDNKIEMKNISILKGD